MSDERAAEDVESPLNPERLEAGTSVLIAGPAMTGKRQLLFDLVGGGDETASILVTTKRDADRFRDSFLETRADPAAWDLRMIDCVSRSHSISRVRDSATTKYVTSAGDLTGIGIAASGFMREFHHEGRGVRIGLHTLSTLLMYADLKRVFQFCHVMNGRMASSGFSGVFTLDTTSRNTEALDVLTGLFDAVVEVRDEGDEPELRVRGADFGPRRWTAF
ncbi:DUF7504 family protein [Halorientalis salina]|uniref:DUF7504 family protein n=1 Tax=Halorientalis salina TaxID=2932266 RepID=UPI0010AB7017|nr:hypothetical protein [Halorientalis salina]